MLEQLQTLGAILAVVTSIFIVVDRFLKERPIASFRIQAGHPAIRIKNVAAVDVLIHQIRAEPKGLLRISRSTSIYDLLSTVIKGDTVAMLKPGEERTFILMGDGQSKLQDAPSQALRLRIVWRRCNRTWLPQIPVTASSSTDDIRAMLIADTR
jgi:hypothetical protein